MKNLILVSTLIVSTFTLSSFLSPDQESTLDKAAKMPGATVLELPYSTAGVLCNGEFLTLEGTIKIVSHFVFDANGGYHITDNWNIKAAGIGSFGNQYLLNYSDNYKENGAFSGFPFNLTNSFNFNIVGKGQAPNLKQSGVFHVTINANNEISAFVDFGNFSCK